MTVESKNTTPMNAVHASPTTGASDIAMDQMTLPELRHLQADIEHAITRQREAARHDALDSIDRLMAEAELTAEEVIAHLGPRRRRKSRKLPAKYQDPQNPQNSWAGRGKKPNWLQAKLERGAKLEDFRIKHSEAEGHTRRDAGKPAGPGASGSEIPRAAPGKSPVPSRRTPHAAPKVAR